MNFKAFMETVEQDNLIHQIVNQLHYGKGYDLTMLSKLPIGRLIFDIEELITSGELQVPPISLSKPVSTNPNDPHAPNMGRLPSENLDPHRLAGMVKSYSANLAAQQQGQI